MCGSCCFTSGDWNPTRGLGAWGLMCCAAVQVTTVSVSRGTTLSAELRGSCDFASSRLSMKQEEEVEVAETENMLLRDEKILN